MTTELDQPNATPVAPVDTSVLLPDAAAPVVPVVVAPVAADEGVVEYEPTGDVGLDMALGFIGKAGLSAEHPAVKAAMEGDFTILKATLAQKGAPGWEQMIALGEAAYTRTTEAAAAKSAALTKLVQDSAGGAAEWALVQKWAGANATPEEKQQINTLLQQGGVAAKSAVNYLLAAYNKAGNVVVNPIDGAANAGHGGPSASNGPLGPKEYSAAVQALGAKLGGRLEGSKEYADLQQRRQAHRG